MNLKIKLDVRDAPHSKNHTTPFVLFSGEKPSLVTAACSKISSSAFTIAHLWHYVYVLPLIPCSQMETAQAILGSKFFPQHHSMLDKTCFPMHRE